MTVSIMVGNGKGGVLKTSITTALSVLAAANGYRTVTVDLDPQGNTDADLGYETDEGEGLLDAARKGLPAPVIRGVRPNLDVIAGGWQLGSLRAVMEAQRGAGRGGGARAVAHAIKARISQEGYDYVFVDTPPLDTFLIEVGMRVADWLVIPSKSDRASRDGLEDTLHTATGLLDDPEVTLRLLGVVLTGVNSTARLVLQDARRSLMGVLGEADADMLMDTAIRHAEASAFAARERGLTPGELAPIQMAQPGERVLPKSVGGLAGDYERLLVEVLERVAVRSAEDEAVTA